MSKDVKVGDVVHVRMTVKQALETGYTECTAVGRFGTWSACIKHEDIVHVETSPLQVGDKVKLSGDCGCADYVVRAIDDDCAFLRNSSGNPCWEWVQNLERV